MIWRLRGTLVDKAYTHAIVDVGGVGYGLSVSLQTSAGLPETGETVHLHVHTYVREDRIQLFGFCDTTERDMFQLLIGVSGIGPSLAQTILSGLSVEDLQRAIHREQVTELTQVKGVGTKTAQRVVVELRDKVSLPAGAAQTEAADDEEKDPVLTEAAMALEALGFAGAAAGKAVAAARRKQGDAATVQDLIKAALRER